MSEQQQFRLRIVFCKQGRLALLSHLEVARALERAVRRAGLPFAISNGFSPHMKIAFGAALPVGVGGTRELVDLTLTEYVNPGIALEALRRASVPDLMVLECAYVESKAPAASAAFPISTYEVVFSSAPASLPVPAQVRIVRKKKEKALNVEDFLVGKPCLKGRVLTLSLEQKPTGSLRPDKLLAACLALAELKGRSGGEGGASRDFPCADAVAGVPEGQGGARSVEGADAALAFIVPNADAAFGGDAEACESVHVLSVTRIDQRPA